MELVAEKYKQSEQGLIPWDWEVKELGSISTVSSGGTPNRGIATYWNGNIPWITTSQINFNTIDSANEFITEEGLNNSAAKIYKAGTLLMAMYGQGKTRGKVAILGIDATTNQACGAITLQKNVLKEYIFLNLSSRYDEIRNLSNTGNQENLNGELIKKILIPLPPTKAEQTAIATSLSDADVLISSLEKLIAKKRNIKQGAMQKLLQPKEGWEVKKLGEVGEIYTGKKNNQDKVENGVYPFFVRSQTIERINSYSFDGEAILIPGEGNIGKIFHYINGKFDFHQRVYKISDFKSGYFSKYIYRYISEYFGRHAMENSVKATVDSLRLPTFQVFEIPFPPTYEDQTRIATILSDMDAEINALETKLEKYRRVKLGMMQNLLTGKIRLV